MELTVKVTTDGNACADHCAFLDDDECLLFRRELSDTRLPEGYEWNDRQPTKSRHWRCYSFDE